MNVAIRDTNLNFSGLMLGALIVFSIPKDIENRWAEIPSFQPWKAIGALEVAKRSPAESVRPDLRDIVYKILPEKEKSLARQLSMVLEHEAQIAKIDPYLLAAQIYQESRFQIHARGLHGEIGLMQIKPSTAHFLNKRYNLGIRNISKALLNPHRNIKLGVLYMSYLMSQFDLDLSTTFEAYNKGPGLIQKRLKAGLGLSYSYIRSIRAHQRMILAMPMMSPPLVASN